MVDISKKTYENNDIGKIIDGIGTLWLNEKHAEVKLGHKNVPVMTNKYDPTQKHMNQQINQKSNQTEDF